MSVAGFSEVREAAVEIAIDDSAPIPVASLPAVGILKLVAWGDAPHRRPQDPIGLCTLMMTYGETLGDLVYTAHGDLYEDADYEERVASARIYGRDMAPLLRDDAARRAVLELLEKNVQDDDRSDLADAMGRQCHYDFNYRLRCLRALLRGIQDRLA